MSQFEFVSVALALVYSFAAARLLAAAPWVFEPSRRYWIHAFWYAVVLLALVVTWWAVWSLRDVQWNAFRFLWALAIPALIYVRVGALVSQDPSSQSSWRDHYYASRVPFFGIGLAIMLNSALIPWVMGIVPWFELARVHAGAGLLFVLYSLAIASPRPGVHGGVVLSNLVMLLVSMIVLTATEFGDACW